jgi:hypothetical protein
VSSEPAARPAAGSPLHPVVGPTVRPSPSRAVAVPLRRAIAIVALFLAGLAAGIGTYAFVNAPPALPALPGLASVPEPAAAHDLAAAIAAGDASGVASRLSPDTASGLSTALASIVDVTAVTYLGTVEEDGRDLAGYVVRGRDKSNTKQIVGLVLAVSGGRIVAINE